MPSILLETDGPAFIMTVVSDDPATKVSTLLNKPSLPKGTTIGVYDSVDEALKVLGAYLDLEASK